MFAEYVYETSQASYSRHILLIDSDNLEETEKYSKSFSEHGFKVIRYKDDLSFRIEHEAELAKDEVRLAVIAGPKDYITYDIQKKLTKFDVGYASLYPKLNEEVLRYEVPGKVSQDILLRAYSVSYETRKSKEETRKFIELDVLGRKNISRYTADVWQKTLSKVDEAASYKDWFAIANAKASIDILNVEYELDNDTAEINRKFKDWILTEFGKLGSTVDKSGPVLVSRVMEYCKERSNKFVIIVMDGMSEFDWGVMSHYFTDLRYRKTSVMAMIPTVTSVSRQCLLGGKYPYQLADPWHQAKEKAEFFDCARNLGFKDSHIEYLRGYDSEFSSFTRCGAIVIMDIDENVHGQKQGRNGMFNDVSLMGKQQKLHDLTIKLLKQGFDVYITADHGNTPCTGIGKIKGTGVETETKSHRMMVLKDFADKDTSVAKYGLIEYPKYYLPKEYDYLICNVGDSFDNKGEDVMNHGGITMDEVIVPFITFTAEEYNG